MNLQVTPKIMPDGKVLMRVIPEVSSVASALVNLGNGQSAAAINLQHFESTMSAMDGETIVMGGMIQKQVTEQENKVPWVGDLPGVGWLFRYRTKSRVQDRTAGHPDAARHSQLCRRGQRCWPTRRRRVDWMVGDVLDIHGTSGMEPAITGELPLFPGMEQPLPLPQEMPRMPPANGPAPKTRIMPPATQLPPPNYYPTNPATSGSLQQTSVYGQPPAPVQEPSNVYVQSMDNPSPNGLPLPGPIGVPATGAGDPVRYNVSNGNQWDSR